MSTKHTPTPWTYTRHEGPGDPWITLHHGAIDIAHTRHSARPIEQEEADAEFIVRAVGCHDELVAALDNIEGRTISCVHGGSTRAALRSVLTNDIRSIARAALAKATGSERTE